MSKLNTSALSNEKLPIPYTASSCVGLSLDEVLKIYKCYEVINSSEKLGGIIDVEIRLPETTITCVFRDGVCFEAFLFSDVDLKL